MVDFLMFIQDQRYALPIFLLHADFWKWPFHRVVSMIADTLDDYILFLFYCSV